MGINLLIGLLGNLFVLLNDMRTVQNLANKANVAFVYRKYFEKEILAILIGIIPIFIYALTFKEITGKYGELGGLERVSFAVVGGIGSWLLQLAFGGSKKWIMSKIDSKTNELDEIKEKINP